MKIFFITKMHKCWMRANERSHKHMYMCVCVWLLCPFLQFGCAYEPAVGFPLSLSNHCLYLCSVHSFHHSTSAFFFKTTMKKHKVFFLHIFVVSRYSMQKKYLEEYWQRKNGVRKKDSLAK